MTVGNTIVAENSAAVSGPDAFGAFGSLGNNLIGETDGSSGWIGSDLTGSAAEPLDPLLAPLGQLRRPDPDDGPLARQPGHRGGQ